MKKQIVFFVFLLASVSLQAQMVDLKQLKEYFPEIHGTIRGKYEYQTTNNTQRFQVRNARVGLVGNIISDKLGYKAEIDLSDEGKIKMLDAYARVTPFSHFTITVGQMRVPFTIDAHRSPHSQYFANRSFIAKQMGSLRDAGMTIGYAREEGIPFSVEAGLFNGSGLTEQKEWHKALSYSGKLILNPFDGYNLTLSTQRIHPNKYSTYMYDVGTFYEWNNWHIEAEGMYKHFAHADYPDVWAVNTFVNYDLFFRNRKFLFKKVSFLARFDYMGNNSDGATDEDGRLRVADHERHRVTGGLTFSFGKPFQADLRLNYEKYFYHELSQAKEAEQDKIVVELMLHF